MIAWFARNGVAANLLMIGLLAMGIYAAMVRIPLEVFPSIASDRVRVVTPYPGATPEEVERAVSVRVEEAVQDLEGIEEIRSYSSEGVSRVDIDVARGHSDRDLLDDVKSRVEAITSFPDGIEPPIYRLAQHRRETISVVVFGEMPEAELRKLAEGVRDGIAALPQITQVELDAVRPYEIAIDVPEARLREYGLTLAEVAAAIQRSSLDIAAGSLRTAGGEVLISAKGQADSADEFTDIPLRTRADGSRLLLGDIATVIDGFAEDPIASRFDGKPAMLIEVYRIGDQSAIDVTEAVKQYIDATQLPEGATLAYWRDRSRIVEARLDTLIKSAVQGMALVLLLLALFLRPLVALWVCAGIPVAFAGGLLLMPEIGVSLNIVSLFAFILVLGIVVDDAIVTGENIYARLNEWRDPLRAAIEGTHEVAVPVTFGVLTTAAAFLPLAFMGGHRGPIFAQITMVVVPVLLFSLVESKLILPAHLKHLKPRDPDVRPNLFSRMQQGIADGFEQFIFTIYRPLLAGATHHRYLTLSLFIGVAMIVFTAVASGWMKFTFFPRVQSELARASLTMPAGTPFATTEGHVRRMAEAARVLQQKYIDPESGESVVRHVLATTGASGGGGSDKGKSHLGRVMFEIVPPEHRTLEISSSELVREWRKAIGPIPGAESVTYRAEIGRGGEPIDVQLVGNDFVAMQSLAAQIKQRLGDYPAVFDIGDSYSDGKRELRLDVLPQAELLGLSVRDVAQQVRQAFFGYEVQTLQRGRDEVDVVVRYPAEERQSLERLYDLRIRTPDGGELPLVEVAELKPSRSPAEIKRIDRQRTLNITADVDKQRADIEAIKADLGGYLNELTAGTPGVRYSLEGEAREQRDSFATLFAGLGFVLFIIYCLLAIPFRSYSQPLMVMSVIPFGVAGAMLGHAIMGMSLSIMSAFGMLALIGVVVNDSLVLVDYVNRRRREGVPELKAVRIAGVARFRPVILTSLTTFAGLTPLIFEKSTQAQFLIPMAVSLGFGILFATMVTLILIPVNYLILEDIRGLLRRIWGWLMGEPAASR